MIIKLELSTTDVNRGLLEWVQKEHGDIAARSGKPGVWSITVNPDGTATARCDLDPPTYYDPRG